MKTTNPVVLKIASESAITIRYQWDEFIGHFNNEQQRNNTVGVIISRSSSSPSLPTYLMYYPYILLAGLTSNNTEEEAQMINQIPTGATNTIAKSLDLIIGDDNHTIEGIADAAQTVITAGTSLPSDISVVTKSLVQISNAISITSSSRIVTQDTPSNQDNTEKTTRKNSNVTSIPFYNDPVRDEYYLWKNEQQFNTVF